MTAPNEADQIRTLEQIKARTTDLEEEIYGNPEKSVIGLKPQMREVQKLIERGKGVMWFMGIVGVSNIVVLFITLAGR